MTTRWLWERQFAAVAADSPAFECTRKSPFSPVEDVKILTDGLAPIDEKWLLHPILLAGWGTPIGELFDLEALSAACKKAGRWTFFLTSVPLNYSGGVGSPPNALAIL